MIIGMTDARRERFAKMNREDATWLALNLCAVPGVTAVDLFGSIARNGGRRGSDIDVIICVDELSAFCWLDELKAYRHQDHDLYKGVPAYFRLLAAQRVLGTEDPIWDACGRRFQSRLDIFLFPEDWRNRLDELQHHGRHHDPQFMQHVAAGARRFDHKTQSFQLSHKVS